MSDLRKTAKGRACQVRIPGVCNGDPATVVLAHVRMAGLTGYGQKAPDVLGAHCCSACHDVVDGRVRTVNWTRDDVLLMFMQGVMRTIGLLCREGLLKW